MGGAGDLRSIRDPVRGNQAGFRGLTLFNRIDFDGLTEGTLSLVREGELRMEGKS